MNQMLMYFNWKDMISVIKIELQNRVEVLQSSLKAS